MQTIKFCEETLAPMIEENAKKGIDTTEFTMVQEVDDYICWEFNFKKLSILKRETGHETWYCGENYYDYSWNSEWGFAFGLLNFDLLKEYLSKFCYKCELTKGKEYRHIYKGIRNSLTLVITLNPKC